MIYCYDSLHFVTIQINVKSSGLWILFVKKKHVQFWGNGMSADLTLVPRATCRFYRTAVKTCVFFFVFPLLEDTFQDTNCKKMFVWFCLDISETCSLATDWIVHIFVHVQRPALGKADESEALWPNFSLQEMVQLHREVLGSDAKQMESEKELQLERFPVNTCNITVSVNLKLVIPSLLSFSSARVQPFSFWSIDLFLARITLRSRKSLARTPSGTSAFGSDIITTASQTYKLFRRTLGQKTWINLIVFCVSKSESFQLRRKCRTIPVSLDFSFVFLGNAD